MEAVNVVEKVSGWLVFRRDALPTKFILWPVPTSETSVTLIIRDTTLRTPAFTVIANV